jgi:hypothetical protein
MEVLGKVTIVTIAVATEAKRNPEFSKFVQMSLSRFILKDWADTASDSVEMNNEAVKEGNQDQLFAVYNTDLTAEGAIWIITEWDNSVTTILFPSDY